MGLLALYLIWGSWFQFDYGEIMGYYTLFAEGLLAGRLSILPTPDEVNLVDMIPYQGRYYLQWGPFPGLLHLPFSGLGFSLTDRVASILATWGSAWIFLEIVLLLQRRHFPDAPRWLPTVFFFLYGLASPAALTALRGTVYNESIAIGACGVLLGLYGLLRFQREPMLRWPLLSGIGLGAAVTTRVTLALYAGVFGLGLLAIVLRRGGNRWAPLMSYAAPVALAVALMLGYNAARFGSPFDYGNRYKPGATSDVATFSLARIPENLGHYLLALPEFSGDFPWIEHDGFGDAQLATRAEAMSSILLTSPFLFFAAIAARRLARSWRLDDWGLTVLLALGGSAAMFVVMMAFAAASRRYAMDFVPLASVAAFLGCGAFLDGKRIRAAGWKLAAIAVIVLSFAIHAQIAFVQSFRTPSADLNALRFLAAVGPTLRQIAPGPELVREEAMARHDWAVTLGQQGRFVEAVEQFRVAAQLLPDSPRIRENLELAERLARGR